MITAFGLSSLVIPALLLTSIAPVILIYLVIKDFKEHKLW